MLASVQNGTSDHGLHCLPSSHLAGLDTSLGSKMDFFLNFNLCPVG